MDFFEQNGVPLKTERGNRVFPISDKALDVVDALLAFAKNGGAEVKTECEVKAILQDGEKVVGVSVLNKKIYAKAILIATGGMSYPLTGSTGDGYRFAKQAGHKIVIPEPSLVPIESREHWCKELQGLSLKNVTLKVLDKSKNKVIYNELGEMLFTHFGVSGPLVLSASSHMSADKMADGKLTAYVTLMSDGSVKSDLRCYAAVYDTAGKLKRVSVLPASFADGEYGKLVELNLGNVSADDTAKIFFWSDYLLPNGA